MFNCTYIEIPDYYSRILKSNVGEGKSALYDLGDTIRYNPSLHTIVKNCFSDIDRNGRIDVILKSVGFLGLRDRLATIFLHKIEYNTFPKNCDKGVVSDITRLEERLAPYSATGYSRGFMLGLYLKMEEASLSKKKSESIRLKIDEKLISLLSLSKTKIVKIDITLLMLAHFRIFLGDRGIQDIIEAGALYDEIYMNLSREQKELFIQNMLNYGLSIDEPQTFYGDTV